MDEEKAAPKKRNKNLAVHQIVYPAPSTAQNPLFFMGFHPMKVGEKSG